MALTSCWWDDSGPTNPSRAPRNTFADFQHISGLVNGVWTKDHNPHVITGDVLVQDGDSLVIQEGVEIVASWTIRVDQGALVMNGSSKAPIRFVHNSSVQGGGVYCTRGVTRISYSIFEANGKSVIVNTDTKIDHSVFSGVILEFTDFYPHALDSTIVKNSIFAGFRPWATTFGRVQFSTFEGSGSRTVLDSSRAIIRNNLFYYGIGDSSWVGNSYFVVDARIQGQGDVNHIQGFSWPGNNNMFSDPKWVKYNYVGPSPLGISDNDYRLQLGSLAIGAATDGTNIGAY